MASVTQKISNYVLGMSAQPDERKSAGQVVDLVNGVPDVVQQLVKRPGSTLLADITTNSNPYGDSATYAVDTGSNSKWFSIYSTDAKQYIGQCAADGDVKIWRCSDGVSIPVDYSLIPGTLKATYLDNTALSDEKSSDIQVLTINETTFFVNRRKTVAMKTGANDKSTSQLNEAFISIDTIAYGKQYALDIFDPDDNTTYTYTRATGIEADEDWELDGTAPSNTGPGQGKCEGAGRSYVTAEDGTDKFSTSPPDMSASGRTNLRYEMDARCTPRPYNQSGSTEGDNWRDTYQPYAKLQFGGEGWDTDDTHSFTSEKLLETTVKVKSHTTVTSRCNIAGVRPSPTASNAEEHVSASGILGEIKSTLDAISGTGITSTIIGNGIHLYRATPFGVTTPERSLMGIATTEVNNISNLPGVCRHGYIVRVANSGEDVDDYYLRFQVENIADDISKSATYSRSGTTVSVASTAHGLANGDTVFIDFTSGGAGDGHYTVSNVSTDAFDLASNSSSGTIGAGATCTYTPARFGEGIWEEVAAPGVEIEIDDDTMPLRLDFVEGGTYAINGGSSRAYTNGVFRFNYPDWGKRDVGDDVTNGLPSFVGNTIQKMVFFRNRITLLSKTNVICSRVNDFHNFWNKTALAISNADPIDLQTSSTFPTKLYDAVETNAGLVLFSANEQFLLSSGAEALLTPETAKVSYLSSYSFDPDTNPVSLGTTIGFLNSTAKNARFYEVAGVSSREPPTILEQSKIIAQLFPSTTTLIAESNENDLILFGTDSTLHTATNEVWGYKYYQQGQKRVQSAWFRWTLPNNLVYHAVMDDVYYVVLNTGSTYTFEKFDLKLSDNTLLIGTDPNTNRVHLDTKKEVATGSLTYNSSTDVTTFTLGAGYYSSKNLTSYCIQAGDFEGKSYDVPSNKITGTAPNETVELAGNWKYYEIPIATTDVTISAETITITGHSLSTAEAVTYQAGSTTISGLTDDTVYYVIKVDDNTIKLATNTSNANSGTAINLTSVGAGTHKIQVPTGIVIGYEYEFEVELPKIYITRAEGDKIRSETRGSLVIHRMNFTFGDVGVIDVILKRTGRADYTSTVESKEWDSVVASAQAISDGYIHTIPVYDRNTNLSVHIKSNHPSPSTINSMNWEGDYSPRYYSRV